MTSIAKSLSFWTQSALNSGAPMSPPPPMTLGVFQFEVLIAVRELGNNAYGVQIRKHMAEKMDRDLHQPQVYSALFKLEKQGFLNSQINKQDTAGRRGRPRRIYALSTPGLRLLNAREGLSIKVSNTGELYGIPEKVATT